MSRIEIQSEVTGKVWKIEVSPGQEVSEDDVLIIVESMKMEIPIVSTDDGTVVEILVSEGDSVEDGKVVAIIEG